MKKALTILLALSMLVLAACTSTSLAPPEDPSPSSPILSPSTTPSDAPPASAIEGAQFVNGYWRFDETKEITVQIFERSSGTGRTDAHDNMYTDWAKDKFLNDCNVRIKEFVPMPRFPEDEIIPTWLAANTAPDVCVTYNHAAIQQYADMDAVWDLQPYIDGHKDQLTYMWDVLGEYLLHYSQDPDTKQIFWIEGRRTVTQRMNTFARADWLAKLNLPEPTTRQEFENMLVAFRDNAELLLGADAAQMVPFVLSTDVGWRTENLAVSFFPPEMSARDEYILGYDDRHVCYPNYKESVRLLNKWYNDKLIWQDFGLYGSGSDQTPEEDMLRAGFVGSFIHNWDYPFRGSGSGINVTIMANNGPDAGFIAIDPFKNDAGVTKKFNMEIVDRKIFFPKTNKEPLASIVYVDWLCHPDVIVYLQLGTEGKNYQIDDEGNFSLITINNDTPDLLPYIINSPTGLDQLIVLNGYWPGDPLTALAGAGGAYTGISPDIVKDAMQKGAANGYYYPSPGLGAVTAESGMGTLLKDKRDSFLTNAIATSVANFDKVYDDGYEEWMLAGVRAIIEERTQKWDAANG
ncbi:MAG: sugar ABC transporter substrate-binding protein [Oscillospiraceae bacterium]|jgi:putative aldouronate transport system substrate-binding protein|nr:sugar ABC transporter substrate-binding protein [Oscillospiraceae bacterium]